MRSLRSFFFLLQSQTSNTHTCISGHFALRCASIDAIGRQLKFWFYAFFSNSYCTNVFLCVWQCVSVYLHIYKSVRVIKGYLNRYVAFCFWILLSAVSCQSSVVSRHFCTFLDFKTQKDVTNSSQSLLLLSNIYTRGYRI